MWSTRIERLTNAGTLQVIIYGDSLPLSFAEVLRRWQNDQEFRSFFMQLLADAPFSAFRWETPPVTAVTASRPLIRSPLPSTLTAQEPPRASFLFSNLGNDAILVVPCPSQPRSAYGHLAAFIREAPEGQKHALWQRVGQIMEQRLGPAPVWLSTAGAGVPWLHVRLDDRPKYYGHDPYRNYQRP
jgi:hypothetical protein